MANNLLILITVLIDAKILRYSTDSRKMFIILYQIFVFYSKISIENGKIDKNRKNR